MVQLFTYSAPWTCAGCSTIPGIFIDDCDTKFDHLPAELAAIVPWATVIEDVGLDHLFLAYSTISDRGSKRSPLLNEYLSTHPNTKLSYPSPPYGSRQANGY